MGRQRRKHRFGRNSPYRELRPCAGATRVARLRAQLLQNQLVSAYMEEGWMKKASGGSFAYPA
jgi:hypothetical protein